jgi:TP901 family phage tail tape measure protein
MASPAAVLSILVNANTAQANAALATTDKQLKKTAATASTASAGMGAKIAKGAKFGAIGVAALGAVSIKAAADFESSFAEVRKTVDTNEKGFKRLETGLRNMAKEIPVSVNELNSLAGQAGALGVKSKDLLRFTRAAAELGTTTDLSAEEAANALARLSNIMGTSPKDFRRLGSVMVRLGNTTAATESEIAAMSLRIAAAGKASGLSESDVLALSASLASVGVRAEAGGSSISKAFDTIRTATIQGGEDLRTIAETAGMTSAQFRRAYEVDAAKAFTAFAVGIREIEAGGGDAVSMLKELELGDIRVMQSLRGAANASDLLKGALKEGSAEWQRNSALSKEANERYKTTEARFQILKNRINDVAIGFGQKLLPAVNDVLDVLTDPKLTAGEKFQKLMDMLAKGIEKAVPVMAKAAAQAAPKVAAAFVKAFIDAPFWGKVLIAGALMNKFGAFGRAGAGAFGGGFKAGLKTAGIGAAILAATEAVTTRGGIKDTFKGEGATLGRDFARDVAGGYSSELRKLMARGNITAIREGVAETRKLARALDEVNPEAARDMRKNAEAAADMADRFAAAHRRINDNIQSLRRQFGQTMPEIRRTVAENMEAIREQLGTKSAEGKAALQRNFQAGVHAIRESMDTGRIKTREGLELINDLLVKYWRTYGITDPQSFLDRSEAHKGGSTLGGKPGGQGLQRGGPIFGGSPTGDSIPAMLERGEYVLNRNAVDKIGKRNLDYLNFAAASRFQAGGGVDLPRYSSSVPVGSVMAAGLNRHADVMTALTQRMMAARHSSGFGSSEGPKGGGPVMNNIREAIAIAASLGHGVSDLYRPGAASFHNPSYSPPHQAVDLAPGSTQLAKALVRAFGSKNILELFWDPMGRYIDNYAWQSGAIGGHSDHVHLAFQKGGAVLDQLVGGSRGWSLNDRTTLAHIAGMKNPGLMGAISMVEAPNHLGGSKANGPPDGRGLWQIEWPVWASTMTGKGLSNAFDPWQNARMARVVQETQGLGAWVVYNNGAYGARGAVNAGLADKMRVAIAGGRPGGSASKPPTFGIGPAWTQAMGVGSGMNLSGGVGAATQLIGGLPSRRVLDRIKHLRRLTPILEEQIANAEIWASMPNSPAGEALSNTEKAEQIKLVTTLLGTLKTRRSLITHALGQIGPGHKKLTGSLSQELQGLQGLTGHGGSILQTIQKLALLGASSTFESEAETARITEMNDLLRQLLKESNLRYAVQSAQTQALLGHAPFAGSFRTGGVVPGAIGSPQVAMVHGGETITPAGGGDIHLHFAPGTEWLRDFVEVTVDKRNRRAARRGGKPMPGRAGVLGG